MAAASVPAEEPWQRHVGRSRFKSIAQRLAPNVDLFASIWDADPTAEIYGGSARDYFWWIRRQLARCATAACVDAFVADAEQSPIEARSFLLAGTDVDVLGEESAKSAVFDKDLFTRIDVSDRHRLIPNERLYDEERQQGGLPVEKLRLGKTALGKPATHDYDGGVDDIYDAHPRMVLTHAIRQTDWFRSKENHPILLVLRWLRQAGVAYAHRWGRGFVDQGPLAQVLDADALEIATGIAATLAAHPEELKPFFENPRFVARLNRARARLFQGFTNPEAARQLYDLVGLDHALVPFADRLEPFLSVTFRKDWSAADLQKHRARLPSATAAMATLQAYYVDSAIPKVANAAPGEVEMFHGTWSPATYRNIATHGILPSERGNAGMGAYAVDRRSSEFAKRWRDPNGSGYALRLILKADATFLDLTSPQGKALLGDFKALLPRLGLPWTEGYIEDALANYLGIDVLKYPYNSAHAYVIKNGAAVLRAEPWSKPLRSLTELRDATRIAADPMGGLRAALLDDASVASHLDYLLADLPLQKRIATHLALTPIDGFETAVATVETLNRYRRKNRDTLPLETWSHFYDTVPVHKVLTRGTLDDRSARAVAAIADAWEFFPLSALLEEHRLMNGDLLGGGVERALREHRAWRQKFLDPIRKGATIAADLVPFVERPLLYVELLEYLEKERPKLYDAAGWRAAWLLVDFERTFTKLHKHVPQEHLHGPLLAAARLRDILTSAFRVAEKAPQVLDQLAQRLRDIQEPRLWTAIDEALVETQTWSSAHSLFLARIAVDLPAESSVWSLFLRQPLRVMPSERLVGQQADLSASRIVLEATRGCFGTLSETITALRNASLAFRDGGAHLRLLCVKILREGARHESIEASWRDEVSRAAIFAAAFGDLPKTLDGNESFIDLVETITTTMPADSPAAAEVLDRLRRWIVATRRKCGSALVASAVGA